MKATSTLPRKAFIAILLLLAVAGGYGVYELMNASETKQVTNEEVCLQMNEKYASIRQVEGEEVLQVKVKDHVLYLVCHWGNQEPNLATDRGRYEELRLRCYEQLRYFLANPWFTKLPDSECALPEALKALGLGLGFEIVDKEGNQLATVAFSLEELSQPYRSSIHYVLTEEDMEDPL